MLDLVKFWRVSGAELAGQHAEILAVLNSDPASSLRASWSPLVNTKAVLTELLHEVGCFPAVDQYLEEKKEAVVVITKTKQNTHKKHTSKTKCTRVVGFISKMPSHEIPFAPCNFLLTTEVQILRPWFSQPRLV